MAFVVPIFSEGFAFHHLTHVAHHTQHVSYLCGNMFSPLANCHECVLLLLDVFYNYKRSAHGWPHLNKDQVCRKRRWPVLGPTFYIGLGPTLINIGLEPTFLYQTRANVFNFLELIQYIGLGPTLKMKISD